MIFSLTSFFPTIESVFFLTFYKSLNVVFVCLTITSNQITRQHMIAIILFLYLIQLAIVNAVTARYEPINPILQNNKYITRPSNTQGPTMGVATKNIPNVVATPFPPLNLVYTGNICPTTATAPSINIQSVDPPSIANLPISANATPFAQSKAKSQRAPTFSDTSHYVHSAGVAAAEILDIFSLYSPYYGRHIYSADKIRSQYGDYFPNNFQVNFLSKIISLPLF